MRNFFLNFDFDETTVPNFIRELEAFENSLDEQLVMKDENGEELHFVPDDPVGKIFVNSHGGQAAYAAVLYDFFKNSLYNYEFVVIEFCDSSAFFLMLALYPEYFSAYNPACALVHKITISLSSRDVERDSDNYDRMRFDETVNKNAVFEEIMKNFLTKSEMRRFVEGGEVFISGARIKTIIETIRKKPSLREKMRYIFEI